MNIFIDCRRGCSDHDRAWEFSIGTRIADLRLYRDGIARVHGMANVQAEELVEYVYYTSLIRRRLN